MGQLSGAFQEIHPSVLLHSTPCTGALHPPHYLVEHLAKNCPTMLDQGQYSNEEFPQEAKHVAPPPPPLVHFPLVLELNRRRATDRVCGSRKSFRRHRR